MDLQLAGATVVVAGSEGDIGAATVRAFARERAHVLAVSREPAGLDAERNVDPMHMDLGAADGPDQLARHAGQVYGGVDVLINNVGPIDLHPGGFLSVDEADLRQVLELNLLIAARTCRAVLPGMIARGTGRIVNLASVTARRPVASLAHYSAAKAALVNLTACLAQEFGPSGIRVNAVSPAPVTSPGHSPVLDLDYATGRPTTPEEVAALVVIVSSPRLGNVTGVDHLIDGGATGRPS